MRLMTPAEMATRLPAGVHGGDGARLAALLDVAPDEVLDLSASLNPFAPDVMGPATACLHELRRYPDTSAATALLADALGVAPEGVLLTNGGAEAIALVGADMGVGRVDDPEFSLYSRHLGALRDDGPRWRSNPNNPTGLLAGPTDRAAVWDEAFYPLATGTWTRGDADCVVVGSLTKLFACPGLRLGYVVADEDTIARLARRQPAWSVNGLALGVLPALLAATDLARWAFDLAKLRDELAALLRLHELGPMPSEASWLLVPGAGDLRSRLACRGVLIRDCSSFGLADTVRIAVPGPADLDRLAKALDESV